jgi:hypothetical protein
MLSKVNIDCDRMFFQTVGSVRKIELGKTWKGTYHQRILQLIKIPHSVSRN